jgi:hypothetical protein
VVQEYAWLVLHFIIHLSAIMILGIQFGQSQVGRIDQIFVHEIHGERRLFTRVTEAHLTSDRDKILDLPLLALGIEPEQVKFVGLPAIDGRMLYMVTMGEGKLAQIEWTIRYL